MTTDRRACTCHPSEAPEPCQHRYAYGECRRAALVERMARAMCAIDFDGDQNVFDLKNNSFRYEYETRASAALDIALEEAAKAAFEACACNCACNLAAAAIRAMKQNNDN